MNHTPTPWKFTHHTNIGGDQMARIDDEKGIFLAGVSDMNLIDHSLRDANAAFIVRAVNAHEELLEAAKLASKIAENWIHDQLDGTSGLKSALEGLESVRKAISKAEGK